MGRRCLQGPQADPRRGTQPALSVSISRDLTFSQAAAPVPPEIVTDTETSTSSLVDVDHDGVRTVPSDFLEQDVQTDTQSSRIAREEDAREERSKKEKATAKARKADSWLTRQFSSLSDNSASALAAANVAGVVALSGFLGYRAWALYEKGRLSWQSVGLGLGILGVVGIGESVLGG